jgi:hypothetical protein
MLAGSVCERLSLCIAAKGIRQLLTKVGYLMPVESFPVLASQADRHGAGAHKRSGFGPPIGFGNKTAMLTC